MKRHGCSTTVDMPKLSMRTSLSDFCKPQLPKKRDDLARLENRRLCHGLRHFDGLRPNELTFESGIAFLEQHLDYFLKVRS